MSGTIITGATGFLGQALTRRLLREGETVFATGRNRDKLDQLTRMGARAIAYDLTSEALPEDLPSTSRLVHCAALSSPWGDRRDFERANVSGTARAIALAKAVGVKRFVHISSPSVYFRFADQDNLPETAPLPAPVNAYAATKADSEKLVLNEPALDPIILRPRGLYGPGDTALLPRLLRAASQRPLPLMRDGRAATDLTFVEDVVDAILAALQVPAPASRIYNVSGGQALEIRHVVESAARQADMAVRWRKVPWPMVKTFAQASEALCARLPGRPEPVITAYTAGLFAFRQTLDIRRAEAELGWRPRTSFDEGLRLTLPGSAT